MPQLGIAVATTLGGWLNAWLLWSTLKQRGAFKADDRLRRNLPLIGLASLAMAAVLYLARGWLGPFMQASRGFLVETVALGALVAIGLLTFAFLILATGVMTPAQFKRFGRRTG